MYLLWENVQRKLLSVVNAKASSMWLPGYHAAHLSVILGGGEHTVKVRCERSCTVWIQHVSSVLLSVVDSGVCGRLLEIL
jgi:hypothetical protein